MSEGRKKMDLAQFCNALFPLEIYCSISASHLALTFNVLPCFTAIFADKLTNPHMKYHCRSLHNFIVY